MFSVYIEMFLKKIKIYSQLSKIKIFQQKMLLISVEIFLKNQNLIH